MQKKTKDEMPNVPFDDALKRILNAPPQHKEAKQKPEKAKKK